ncbi:MAG: fumarylacetoacetate hydrolase family protein [Burkholderiaceae bacterium]
MKLASYKASGAVSYGAVIDDRLIDLGRRFGKRYPDLRAVLEAQAIPELASAMSDTGLPTYSLASVDLLPPIGNPDKILCIGRNYQAHAAEANNTVSPFPLLFLRLTNTLVAHEQPMVRPKVSGDFDYEGELAVIIGKPGRHIPKDEALQYVAGYSCFNDGSIRDYQFQHCLTTGKNFHASGGFGPFLVLTDEVPDPSALTLSTRLNGVQVQHSGVDQLVFDIPTLIHYISSFTPLAAGDVICTGTPEGVGCFRKPPLWMKPGDVIEVDIPGVGVLRNPIISEEPGTSG